MFGQVVAEFRHGGGCLRVDPARWLGTGAERLDVGAAVHPSEGFGHLTAVGILDANEQQPPHGRPPFKAKTCTLAAYSFTSCWPMIVARSSWIAGGGQHSACGSDDEAGEQQPACPSI